MRHFILFNIILICAREKQGKGWNAVLENSSAVVKSPLQSDVYHKAQNSRLMQCCIFQGVAFWLKDETKPPTP